MANDLFRRLPDGRDRLPLTDGGVVSKNAKALYEVEFWPATSSTGTGVLPAQRATVVSTTGVGASVSPPADQTKTLDIDFTVGTLDPRITFSRASAATYYNSAGVVTLATSDVPRFDYDPVTLAARGLLLEASSTNQILYSEDMTNAYWAPFVSGTGSSSRTANAGTAPSGASTATLLTVNRSADDWAQGFAGPFTHVGAEQGVCSVYLKAYAPADVGKVVDILVWAGVNAGSQLVTLTNSWVRYEVASPNYGSNTLQFIVGLSPSSITGNTQMGQVQFLAWGAQTEYGLAVASSYIPTTSAAVTRVADAAVMTGTNFSSWYNATEGTLVADFRPQSVTGTQPVISANDNTANEAIQLYGSGTDPKATVIDGGVPQADLDAGTIAANSFYKLGLVYKLNDFGACLDGGTVVTDAAGTLPTVTRLMLGADGTTVANLHVRRLIYYNIRRTNAELQTLTSGGALVVTTPLVAAAATVTGIGVYGIPAVSSAGTLAAQSATVVSTAGVSRSSSTAGTLAATAAAVASTTGISGSVITDTTLNAGSAAVVSTAGRTSSVNVTGTLVAQISVVVSTAGVSRSSSTSAALAPARATLVGLGAGTALTGTGSVATQPASAAGSGLTVATGVGALQSEAAIGDGQGVGQFIATAANLNAEAGIITGLGEIPFDVLVSGAYAHRDNLWEGSLVWGKIEGKWRRLRVWAKAAPGWGVSTWTPATQEVPVIVPAVVEVPKPKPVPVPVREPPRLTLVPPVVAPRMSEGGGDLVAGAAHVTNSNSISGVSSLTHGSWEAAPAWLKVNGKWRRTTMWTKVSGEWKRVA